MSVYTPHPTGIAERTPRLPPICPRADHSQAQGQGQPAGSYQVPSTSPSTHTRWQRRDCLPCTGWPILGGRPPQSHCTQLGVLHFPSTISSPAVASGGLILLQEECEGAQGGAQSSTPVPGLRCFPAGVKVGELVRAFRRNAECTYSVLCFLRTDITTACPFLGAWPEGLRPRDHLG